MHRAILIACLPCLIAITIAIVIAWVTVRLSGAKLRLKRLKEIHSCERGSVQTLSFVLTLPIFIIITMFIVQVSQLMIGVMTVNYAAFAAARSASVWIPAQIGIPDEFDDFNWTNHLPSPVLGTSDGPSILIQHDSGSLDESRKCREIFIAAIQGCAPICPSNGQSHLQESPLASNLIAASVNGFEQLTAASHQNPGIPKRLGNKIRYAFANTAVRIQYLNKHAIEGPTYNPIGHPSPAYPFYENAVGWDDPMTVTITHQFALLPGPGRLLAKLLVRSDGEPDLVSPRIDFTSGTYKTPIVAKVTLTNEGLTSVIPYQQEDR